MSCIWNLSSICRFCHSDGNFRTFTLPNNNNGKLESYGDMLLKTFNISMTIPTGVNASNMICDDCISSLTDAAKFKEQVQACENKFQQYVKNEFFTLESDVKDSFAQDVKIENNDEDNSTNMKVGVKFDAASQVKIEKTSNSEFEDDDLCFGDNSHDENYRTDENIAEPDLKPQVKDKVANKDDDLCFGDNSHDENYTTDEKIAKPGLKPQVKDKVANKDDDLCFGDNSHDENYTTHENIAKPGLKPQVKDKVANKDDDLCFGDNSHDENYTTDENIAKPDLKPQLKDKVAKKGQKNSKRKKSIGKKIKQNGDKDIIRNNITCQVCFKKLLNSDLVEHLKTHRRPYNCKFCEQKFNIYNSLSIHIRNEHSKNMYTCNFCKKTCKTEAMLFNHLDRHTRQNIFECDICHRRMEKKSVIVRHIKTHDPMRMDKCYECSQCSWKFANSTNLSNHIKAVHEHIRNYHCTLCPGRFAAKKNLDIHFRIHTNERPYECKICQQKFRVLEYLKRHKRLRHQDPHPIITKEKKYKCRTCNIKFDHRGLYVDHLKTHPENSSICEKCGMVIPCKNSLKRHILTHAKLRFACDSCDKTFKTKFAVQRHIKRFHLNINRKSKCEICGKLVVNLKQHQLTHNNRRFACTLCDKSYSERKTLKRHLKDVHSGYKLYGCEVCGKRYINKRNLLTHNLKCRID